VLLLVRLLPSLRFWTSARDAVVSDYPLPVQWTGRQAVVTFPEHVDASNVGQIREQLLGVVNRGARVLIADMGGTVSCDYGGADALARTHQRANVNGTQLRVVVAAPGVRRVLEVSGLDRLVSIYPDLETATAPALAVVLPFTRGLGQAAGDGRARPERAQGAPRIPPVAAVTPAVLWNLVDSLADGIALADDGGVLALTNRRLEEMFGYERGELTGRRVESLIPADLRAAHVRHRAGYAADGRARLMADGARLVGLRKDGATVPVRISLSPVPTRTGHFTLAVVRDMTRVQQGYDLAELSRAAVAAEHERRSEQLLDTVVNSLFQVGLSLQAAAELPHDLAVQRIADAVQRVDETIRQIRDHVFADRGQHSLPAEAPPHTAR
jgi:anti-anti-sigma factor